MNFGPVEGIKLREAWRIVRLCGLARTKVAWAVVGYYLLSAVNAAVDGIAAVLLVSLIMANETLEASNRILGATISVLEEFGVSLTTESLLLGLVILILVRALFQFIVYGLDGLISPIVRRRLQQVLFGNLLGADWEAMRSARVGESVSTMTEQIAMVTKYLYSIIRFGYFLLALVILLAVSLAVSIRLTVLMIIAGIPILLIFQVLISVQAGLSVREAVARRALTGDISERLANLFQIKIEAGMAGHFKAGMRHQQELTRREVQIGFSQAAILATIVLAPALILLAFYGWSVWRGRAIEDTLTLLAGVGIIGTRASVQLNGVVSMWGNVSRFAGNIVPVYRLLTIRQERQRQLMPELLRGIDVSGVGYAYDENAKIQNVTFAVDRGQPLLIQGPSGSGKTTIANLAAGIYRPDSGHVTYLGDSGRRYDSVDFRAKVGYVAQDVYMFQGSIRENLTPADSPVTDNTIWACLEGVGASDFVRSIGGLDTPVSEAGRSLSGGERRRLAVARCLLTCPHFLIFDEITAGLDERNELIVRDTVMRVSENTVAIIITHEHIFDEVESTLVLE